MARRGIPSCSILALTLAALAAGCASNKPGELPENFSEPAVESQKLVCEPPAFEEDDTRLLDRSQVHIERFVYSTSRWFGGLFGQSNVECAGNVRRGYVSLGTRWDERDGTKVRARFRASVALPALSRRANLVIGRGDADRIIEGTADENIQTLPDRFNDLGEQDFLLGLGYSRGGGLRKGWDLGAGVKLSFPLDPYVRARYHLNPVVADRWLWRLTPQLFWQDSRGWGVSLANSVDFAVSPKWMLRSSTTLVEDEVSEGIDWTQIFSAYRSISRRSAVAYSVFAVGETDRAVPIKDAGFQIRYRRRILREWFFVELLTSLSYPREFLFEERKSNIGVGIEFEMQFGAWPDWR